MGIRTKLVLGSAGLLALLVLLGVTGASWTTRLGGSIDVILRENYRSVQACQEMIESIERMDSGALFALAGDAEQGRALVDLHAPRFEQALEVELGNITVPGEGERAERLRGIFHQYRELLPVVFDASRPIEERRDHYFHVLLPLFQGAKDTTREILHLNQENMVAAKERARGEARTARQQMFTLLFAGLAAAILFVGLMGQSILGPLRRLTRSAREIEHGNLDLVVPTGSKDEMGQLAVAFNEMAARLRELRRSDQARLLRAQQVSQQAIDSLPHAIALFSPERTIELANSAAASFLGLRPGSVAPSAHAGWLVPLLERAERDPLPPPANLDGALQTFNAGREIFLLPQAIAIRDAEQRLLGTTLVAEDVTERRRAEEMKSGVLSTVSHELRTPLTSLQMTLHLMLEEKVGPLTAEQSDLLVGADEDAQRLRHIVEGLLDLSRAERGVQQLRLASVSPQDFVEHAVAAVRPAFEESHVELAVDLDADLPRLDADPVRIGFVLSNLLKNALAHVPAGGRVTVRGRAQGDRVAFSVEDTGPGVPPLYIGRIFERFFQVPGTEARGGVGLGLPISKEIVQAHGGSMRVESPPGKGATFTFEVPIHAAGHGTTTPRHAQ
jgi:signal transduction histidine kinase